VLPARWVVWSRGAFLAALLGTIAPVAAHAQEPEVDPVADSVQADTTGQADDDAKGHLDIGGAVRLNYFWQDYNQPRRDRGGDFGFELFRLDVDGDYEAIDLSVQYRWYAFFEAVHHAYFAYQPGPGWDLHLGISQVPFGILPYASHSFWFGATYYMGYEDDYDMGLKLLFTNGPWEVQAAFYKNAEYIDASRTARYSFDLVTSGEQANQEINQWNLRAAREWRPVAWLIARVGASAEYGQIYNDITTLKGNRRAFALHADFVAGTWNLQLQGIDYRYRPENPPGVDPNTVQLAAFTFPFLMAGGHGQPGQGFRRGSQAAGHHQVLRRSQQGVPPWPQRPHVHAGRHWMPVGEGRVIYLCRRHHRSEHVVRGGARDRTRPPRIRRVELSAQRELWFLLLAWPGRS
jgi:hypothetical protein